MLHSIVGIGWDLQLLRPTDKFIIVKASFLSRVFISSTRTLISNPGELGSCSPCFQSEVVTVILVKALNNSLNKKQLYCKPSSLDLKTSTEADPLLKAGNLLKGSMICTAKSAFIRFNRKHLWCRFKMCPRMLEHGRRVKNSSMGRSKEPLDKL